MSAWLATGAWTWPAIMSGLVVLALAWVVVPLLRGRREASRIAASSANLAALRTRWDELAVERAAGLLDAASHAAAEADLARRALDDAPAPVVASRMPPRYALPALLLLFPAAAFLLYGWLGDAAMVRSAAGATAGAEVGPGELREYLAHHPDDGRAWVLLGHAETTAERYAAAADAFARAVTLAKPARDPGVWCAYADALGMAQGGKLSGAPLVLIERALALDPRHPQALELAGSAAYERGDFAAVRRYWTALQAELPRDSVAAREVAAALERLARRGLLAER